MVFEDSLVLCCVVSHTKNERRLFNFEEFVSFRKWSKYAYKKGVGSNEVMLVSLIRECVSENPMFIIFVPYST